MKYLISSAKCICETTDEEENWLESLIISSTTIGCSSMLLHPTNYYGSKSMSSS